MEHDFIDHVSIDFDRFELDRMTPEKRHAIMAVFLDRKYKEIASMIRIQPRAPFIAHNNQVNIPQLPSFMIVVSTPHDAKGGEMIARMLKNRTTQEKGEFYTFHPLADISEVLGNEQGTQTDHCPD